VKKAKNKRKGQATIEYILLLVVITIVFVKVISHVQDVFYGMNGQQGAVELFMSKQIVGKLSTPPGWI
jgi:Flp pilus assembly pilin Flp